MRPPIWYTPIPQPNFSNSYPHFQQQTYNTSFSQPISTFNPDDVYPPLIQPIQPTQPFTNYQQEQLLEMPAFSIQDFDGMVIQGNTSQQNPDLSSDSSPSPPPRQQTEQLGKGIGIKKVQGVELGDTIINCICTSYYNRILFFNISLSLLQ